MYNWAERRSCRHQSVAGWFGEQLDLCRTSCDICLDADILGGLTAVRQTTGSVVVEATAGLRDSPLFEELRALRRSLADERNVPAYVVFSDATLLAMTEQRPTTEAELLSISGAGPKKLATFGDAFLEAIHRAS